MSLLQTIKSSWADIKDNTSSTLRTTWNLWTKAGLVAQASIVGKEFGIAPEITEPIAELSAKLPQILNISSDIPGIWNLLMQIEWLRNLSEDAQNFWNIAVYMGIFTIIYLIWRWMWGEKWRFEAFWNSIVWTALAAWCLNEFYQFTQENWRDVLSWMPLWFFDTLSDSLKDYLYESPENRKEAWGVLSLWVWVWLYTKGVKNLIHSIVWPEFLKKGNGRWLRKKKDISQ